MRPWVVFLAAIGAVAIGFPMETAGEDGPVGVSPAGPHLTVTGFWGFLPHSVIVGWADRANPREEVLWVDLEQPTPGLARTEVGYAPSALRSGEGGPSAGPRPPGATADLVCVWVKLWWLLGPPAAWSAFAGWRAVRRRTGKTSAAWRWARPWAAAFAVLGVGVLADEARVPPGRGPSGIELRVRPQREPATPWRPRSVSVGLARREPGAAEPTRADVDLWWFAAAALAGNAVTLARSRRRAARRRAEPAA